RYIHYPHSCPTRRSSDLKVSRVSDTNPLELGHLHEADGRWRIYVFGDDKAATDAANKANTFGEWLGTDRNSPVVKYTRRDEDVKDRKSTRLNSSHVSISY